MSCQHCGGPGQHVGDCPKDPAAALNKIKALKKDAEGVARSYLTALPHEGCARYSADPDVQPTCYKRSRVIDAYCDRCLAVYHFAEFLKALNRLTQVPE